MGAIIVDISEKDKSLVLSFLKRLNLPVKELSEEDKEDMALVKAMFKGRTGKYVSKEVIMKKLQK
ncbi:MAG: hypothetical protein M9916_00805 [Crocinitomicaceae bacterium]|nr:hypothetical protein [Crocinitomicaceae bacterium]